eukprot:12704454-Alexandrium_andersonii.AAC.1
MPGADTTHSRRIDWAVATARKQLTRAQGCSAKGRQTANTHAQGCGQQAARPCPRVFCRRAA